MLTDATVRNAKPKNKPYKLTDGRGLYVVVNHTGKYFRFDYRFRGKRKTLALGVYPDVSLSQARDRLYEARKLLADDIDPAEYRKVAKTMITEQLTNGFETIAREWFTKNKHTWTDKYADTVLSRLENNVFPWIGSRPITEVSPPELLQALRRIEERGAIETAHRVKQVCGQIFRYAIACGRAERDPSADLKGALAPAKSQSMATITDPQQITGLLQAIDGYQGHLITRCALRFAPLVFVRPGELRHAEWTEFNQ